jgi:hypothetical protein
VKNFVVFCAILAMFAIDDASAGTWTTLDYPGGYGTWVSGISGNNLVGFYADSPNYYGYGNRAFSYNGTNWAAINPPGAGATRACGIDGNKIVGYYADGSGNHGFSYDGAVYATIDYPGTNVTAVYGIDGSNLVGMHLDASGNARGFFYNGTDFTPLDMPGAVQTWVYGIDGSNLVGCYRNTSGPPTPTSDHNFIYNMANDVWTSFDVPGAISTRINGISGSNIVGSYYDGSATHGFLYDGANLTTLDFPGSVAYNEALGIDGNKIVGVYETVQSGVLSGGPEFHGFVYTIPEPATMGLLALGGIFLRSKKPGYRNRVQGTERK